VDIETLKHENEDLKRKVEELQQRIEELTAEKVFLLKDLLSTCSLGFKTQERDRRLMLKFLREAKFLKLRLISWQISEKKFHLKERNEFHNVSIFVCVLQQMGTS
jgi:hypothetical protein